MRLLTINKIASRQHQLTLIKIGDISRQSIFIYIYIYIYMYIFIYMCVLVWYQQKPLYCTIKWIKTKLQAEGYGCHTCQHIHHYTLLTSWLYPKEMRKYQKFEIECQIVYARNFRAGFAMKMNKFVTKTSINWKPLCCAAFQPKVPMCTCFR